MDSSLPKSGQIPGVNNFELLDFFDDANNVDDIEHFVDLIRGEGEDQFVGFDRDFITGGFDPTVLDQGDMFGDFNAVTGLLSGSNNDHRETKGDTHGQDQTPEAEDNNDEDEDDEDSLDRQEGSETNTSTAKSKADRSKTLISERRRRGKMKEKLYALRSLVPNITKMDKASIVGDAVRYVKELQTQANKLKEEIGGLEASLVGQDQRDKAPTPTFKANHILTNSNQLMISKYVIQMDVFQVEERGFYLRLACNKGDGIAASMYKVLESLTSFTIQSSHLTYATDRFELTVTLRVKDGVRDVNLPNLKLWIVGSLLNEGFEFKSAFCP